MPLTPDLESGDRSHSLSPVESVAQISVILQDTDPTLDPELASLARQAAAEGIVLLRNERETLPLGLQSVAVFGRVQYDWFTVGYGSGGDVKVPYVWNLIAGLRDAGIAVDGELAGVYQEWCAQNRPSHSGTWGTWPHHFPEMPLEDGVVKAAALRTDIALIVIGRAAGEARESLREPGSFLLTDDERHLLDQVTTSFERTVVVIDAGNVMDLSWLSDYGERISAVLYAWQGGMEGARAVAGVLAGELMPSGKLTDTIAFSYEDYPSSANFGDPDVSHYAEDVFVGYRYFETFAPERVQFGFGFGLGYTTFALEIEKTVIDSDTLIAVVNVSNTGTQHSGKEVVQIYVGAPDGALSQPARRLAAYAKTPELAPGEKARVEMSFALTDFASFDDSGVTGHRSAYVLEPGTYPVFLGTDVRSAVEITAFEVSELRIVQKLRETAAVKAETPFDRMVLARDAEGRAVVAWEPAPTASVARAERVRAGLPEEVSPTGDQGIVLDDVAAGRATLDSFIAQLSDVELAAIAHGDITMHSPLGVPGNAGVLGGVTESLRAKGVRPVTTTDGPSGIRIGAYASLLPSGTALASSWNTSLVEELAALHGQEMVHKGSDVLLSPGMNLHRDPLCGRNFEYFSEDPLVTGRTGAAVVRGVQSAGVSACPKHFAVNNQETNRTRHDARVSERALRELYLRGFEICVREANPKTIMTSYNKVNGVWAHYHYDLVTSLLREEWGYEGCVITDWWMEDDVDPDFPALTNNAFRVRAQVDVLMPGGVKTESGPQDYADDTILTSLQQAEGLTRGELQRGARNVLGLVLALTPTIDGRSSSR
ncbi:glycoside hydrolase family 3 N-terminal domain-containing protein [Populibacterium corticicola]|uniref:Glycoside hydrolase family 3 N-terminal domain-containing protein n=1 Tax=Populibacterium corticicola TaxID=1812826 RepID=A0ABW5XDD4_9MICO